MNADIIVGNPRLESHMLTYRWTLTARPAYTCSLSETHRQSCIGLLSKHMQDWLWVSNNVQTSAVQNS